MTIDEHYRGREHSWVKHQLLERYLESVLSIIGVGGHVTSISYVDCFSGPWGDESEDLAGTSIAISLRIIEQVRADLQSRHGVQTISFRAIYVEKNPKSFARLQKYLKEHAPSTVECHALPGDCFDQQDEILRLCKNSFAFFFIDPKGWRDVGIERLQKLLARPHSEFLINFMYDFLNRAIGMDKLRRQVEELLGPMSESEVRQLRAKDPKERSEAIVRRYRDALKVAMSAGTRLRARSFHAEVLNKDKERLHYHLVYLSRHPKGVIKFAEASQDADFLQTLLRIESRQESNAQPGLFSPFEQATLGAANQGSLATVEATLLARLSRTPTKCDEAFLADLLEETGWFIRDIERVLSELIRTGRVRNLDAARARTKHPVHWHKNERLVLVEAA